MKEALRKLKGCSFNCDIGEIELTDIFREGKAGFNADHSEFDQLYFSTQHNSLIAKVYDLESELSQERFRHEEYPPPDSDRSTTRGSTCSWQSTSSSKKFKLRKKTMEYSYSKLLRTPSFRISTPPSPTTTGSVLPKQS